MNDPKTSDKPTSESAIRRANKISEKYKITKEINNLGNNNWHFIVGWTLSSVSLVIIIIGLETYQVFHGGGALYFYSIIIATYLVCCGSDIYRHLKRINKRIDKIVELINLENSEDL